MRGGRDRSGPPREPRLVACIVAAVLAIALVLLAFPAAAATQRYAVVVGTNAGGPDDPLLRYAERDARRMADVLQRLARVPPENLVLLVDADAADVTRALADVDRRIAGQRAGGSADDTLLFFFYSGHADEQGLRARGTQLPFAELRATLQGSAADVRVVVLDACRSGGLTRRKGARPVEPFVIDVEARLAGEGIAIITSAAESEDAQESDRLQGSFFTHHFVSGLLGAADSSGDRRVSLVEAYEYTYTETLRSTSRTQQVQHPTYAFDLRGQRDLVLTTLDGDRRVARLQLVDPGSYVLFEGGEGGPITAEVSAGAGAELALEPGRYLVRRRGAWAAHDAVVSIAEGERRALALAEMQPQPYGLVVRKGLAADADLVWGLTTAAGVSGGIVPETGPLVLGSVGLRLDLEPLSLQLALRYGYGAATNDTLAQQQHVLGLDLALLKLFDVGQLTLGFGLRGGGDHVWQRFDTVGEAPDRAAFLGRAGGLLHAAWAPLPWFTLTIEGAGDAVFLGPMDTGSGSTDRTVRFVPSVLVGLLFHL